MAYVLLWLESLAVSLLLVATLTACLARLRPGPARRGLLVIAAIAPLAVYAAATVLAAYARFVLGSALPWFWPLAALTGCYLAGAAWTCRRGLAPAAQEPPAATWPRGKLALALGAAVAVHLITFWNLDLTIRHRLGAMRAEAGAMALSVAPARVPDRDNAAFLYQQAFERLCPKDRAKGWGWVPDGWKESWAKAVEDGGAAAFDPNDPDLAAFLRRHEATLRLLHAAAGKTGCYFEHEYNSLTLFELMPEVPGMRWTTSLLALSARSRAARGDVRGALRDIHALFVQAEHAGSTPILISALTALRADGAAMAALRAVLAAGRASPDDLAALRVEESLSYRRLLERSVRMEEAFRLAVFSSMEGGRASDSEAWMLYGFSPSLRPVYRIFLLRNDLAAHSRLSAEHRRLAARAYHEARDGWEKVEQDVPIGPMAILTNHLTPALGGAARMCAQGDARRGVARTALAAVRYRARHGRLPGTPADLVGELLTVVPVDPFDGRAIRWKPTKDGAVVYSIGPDGKDDGGAPFDAEKRTGDISLTLK